MDAPIKCGVIGVGTQGRLHVHILQSFRPEVTVMAISDLNLERVRWVARKYNVPYRFTDYDEMLSDVELDVVIVATPDPYHYYPTMAAIKAKKHVLVEKPLATSVKEAEEIVQAARDANIILSVNFSNRFMPQMILTKQLIEQGKLGEPVYAFARLSNTLYVPTQMIRAWVHDTSLPFWLMSHTIDRVRWLFQQEIVSVFARTHHGILRRRGINVNDLYVAVVEFDNGAVATFESSWILPESRPSIVDSRMDLIFSRGSVSFDTISPAPQVSTSERFEMPYPVQFEIHGRPYGMVTESVRTFINAVRTGAQPFVSAEDGLIAVKVAAAIVESAETGKPVSIS